MRRLVSTADTTLDTPVAVVFSHEGKVKYPIRHQDFPYFPSLSGKLLPPKCASSKAGLAPDHLSAITEVDPSLWLDDDQARKVDYMSEQVLVQNGDHRVTLLTASLKDEDEEDDRRSSWNPRFH